MALDRSVLSELLAAFPSGEGLDLIRESVRLVCQELIEAEVSVLLGAGPMCAPMSAPTNATGTVAQCSPPRPVTWAWLPTR